MSAEGKTVKPGDAARGAIPVSRIAVCFWLIFFVAAGLYIRMQEPFYSYPYNNDESILMGIVNASSFKELMHFALYDSHPPLFYILAHYWSAISANPHFVRCLQLIMGITLIPLYYLIGKCINGRLCGLCCAALVTFSFGAIIQSYVMRQYCVLLLSLSLNFYCYLNWRRSRKRSALLGYVITGWLVALSHFFSDFYFFCIVSYETIALFCMRSAIGRRKLVEWVLANLAIGIMVAFLYYFWQPTLSFYRAEYPRQLVTALSAPFYAASYIYPAPIPLLPILFLYACLPAFASETRIRLRPHLILGGTACLISMAIYSCGIFEWLGTRHCLWMFPLLIPAAGGMLADILERRTASVGYFPKTAVAGLIFLSAVCDTGRRFTDEDYTGWQRGTVQEVTRIADGFGPGDVLITDKDGLNILSTMQPYKTDEAFMNTKVPVLAPYKNTHFLLNSDYFGIYSPFAVRRMIKEANAHHLLDNIDRLVFVKFWNKWPFYSLVACDALQKQIVYPPPSSSDRTSFTGEFAIMTVSKQVFFDEVLSPSGKARACLDQNQDTIPEWYYIPRTAKHDSRFKWDPTRKD
jgi:hypothetical protein